MQRKEHQAWLDHLTSSATLIQNKMIIIENTIWQVAIKYVLDYCLRPMFHLMLLFIGSGFYYVFIYWLRTKYELQHFLWDPVQHFHSARLPAAGSDGRAVLRACQPQHTTILTTSHYHTMPPCHATLPHAAQMQGSGFALSFLRGGWCMPSLSAPTLPAGLSSTAPEALDSSEGARGSETT